MRKTELLSYSPAVGAGASSGRAAPSSRPHEKAASEARPAMAGRSTSYLRRPLLSAGSGAKYRCVLLLDRPLADESLYSAAMLIDQPPVPTITIFFMVFYPLIHDYNL